MRRSYCPDPCMSKALKVGNNSTTIRPDNTFEVSIGSYRLKRLYRLHRARYVGLSQGVLGAIQLLRKRPYLFDMGKLMTSLRMVLRTVLV